MEESQFTDNWGQFRGNKPSTHFGKRDDVIHQWTWNVTDPGVQEYSILWDAAGAHMSVSKVTLDTLEFTPVPEPAEYASMTVAGLLGLALWRRRRGCRVSGAEGEGRAQR
jgi:hypothetical protein